MSCSGAVFAFFPCTESVGISLTFTKKKPNPCRLCWVPAGWRWPSCRGGRSVAWQFLQLKRYQVTLFPENPREPHPTAKEGFSRSTTLQRNVCTSKAVSCDLSGRPWPTCNASMSSLLKVGVVTAPQGPGPPSCSREGNPHYQCPTALQLWIFNQARDKLLRQIKAVHLDATCIPHGLPATGTSRSFWPLHWDSAPAELNTSPPHVGVGGVLRSSA